MVLLRTLILMLGSVSVAKRCVGQACEETDREVLLQTSRLTASTLTRTTAATRVGQPTPPTLTCALDGIVFTPHDMAGQTRSTELSAQDCQARCYSVVGCAHFAYWPDGGCHLQSSEAVPQFEAAGLVSGPPNCEANSPSASATCVVNTPGTCTSVWGLGHTCFEWRGPTDCVGGRCRCQPGFCDTGDGICVPESNPTCDSISCPTNRLKKTGVGHCDGECSVDTCCHAPCDAQTVDGNLSSFAVPELTNNTNAQFAGVADMPWAEMMSTNSSLWLNNYFSRFVGCRMRVLDVTKVTASRLSGIADMASASMAGIGDAPVITFGTGAYYEDLPDWTGVGTQVTDLLYHLVGYVSETQRVANTWFLPLLSEQWLLITAVASGSDWIQYTLLDHHGGSFDAVLQVL